MEISIDLHKYLLIALHDRRLMLEMLSEWMSDTALRINALKEYQLIPFKEIHYLKTSFAMISCVEGIKICEAMISEPEKNKLQELDLIFERVKKIIQDQNNIV